MTEILACAWILALFLGHALAWPLLLAAAIAGGTFWHDSLRVDLLADPEQAMADVRAAHRWASRELAGAVDPTRQFNLAAERKRLAGIAWQLKRRIGA